jgi:hypothetical protein
VSCATSGDKGPTVYIETKARKSKTNIKYKNQKQSVPHQDNNPSRFSNIPP